MTEEEYHQIRVGTQVTFQGKTYTVTAIEYVYYPTYRERLPYTVTLHTGENLKPQDRIVSDMHIVT